MCLLKLASFRMILHEESKVCHKICNYNCASYGQALKNVVFG